MVGSLDPQELDVLRAIRRSGSASIPDLSQILSDPPRGPVLRSILGRLIKKRMITQTYVDAEAVYIALPVAPVTTPRRSRGLLARMFPEIFGDSLEQEDLSYSEEHLKELRHYVREARTDS